MTLIDFLKYSKWFATQKFRFDLGLLSFMPIVNLVLIVIGVSDKLNELISIPAAIISIIGPPLAIFCTWLFGHILDKLRFQHNVNDNIAQRNPQLQEILDLNKKTIETLEKQ